MADLLSFELSLVELAHKWRRVVDDELRPFGLSQATWRTLYFISRTGGEIPQKGLAFAIGIEGPSLVHLLDQLENVGLIERRVSRTDRRAKSVHLLDKGSTQVEIIQDVLSQVRHRLLDDIDPAQLESCSEVFAQILDNAENGKPAQMVTGDV
ncbi:MAG: MarR family transcriptional regulator [Rhodospirillaceae bacterium]